MNELLDKAESWDTPSDELSELAMNKDVKIRIALAENKNTPPEALKKLGTSRSEKIRMHVASNPSTPNEVLEKMLSDTEEVKGWLSTNPNASDFIFMELAKGDNIKNSHYFLAASKYATPESLKSLMRFYDDDISWLWRLYESLAYNPNTPQECLLRLFNYKGSKMLDTDEMHVILLKNTNCPEEILIKFMHKNYAQYRYYVASHPNSNQLILEIMSRDKEPWIIETVACNPNTPAIVLNRLAKHASVNVRQKLASNISLPEPIMAMLSKDRKEDVRVALAYNRSIPIELRKILLEDKKENVRIAAESIYQKSHTAPDIEIRETLERNIVE